MESSIPAVEGAVAKVKRFREPDVLRSLVSSLFVGSVGGALGGVAATREADRMMPPWPVDRRRQFAFGRALHSGGRYALFFLGVSLGTEFIAQARQELDLMNSVAAGTVAGTVFAVPHGLKATVYGTGMGVLVGGLYGTAWCARHLANEAAQKRERERMEREQPRVGDNPL